MKTNGQSYANELERALARPDVEKLLRQSDRYIAYWESTAGDREWHDDEFDDFSEIIDSGLPDYLGFYDPDKAMAYIIFAIAKSDDPQTLAICGCLMLEDLLRDPSDELLERVVAEAHRSPRFRWMLSNPYKNSISAKAWEAIEQFRITGPHEEPAFDTLPPR